MKIVNIRRGWATNSSSVHSIVLGSFPDNFSLDFGWDAFMCSSPQAKRIYFATCLASWFSIGTALKIYYPKARGSQRNQLRLMLQSAQIDHQSLPDKPLGSPSAVKHFFRDVTLPIINGPYSIVGGNDNGGMEHLRDYWVLQLFYSLTYSFTRIKEYSWGYSVLSESGTRFRFAKKLHFYRGKTSTPELIDFKITNRCNSTRGCRKWCYQKSGPGGKHGDLNQIKGYINSLAKAGVFEIAIGGGEATLHPNFRAICAYIAKKGIVPNLSTGNIDFMLSLDPWKRDREFYLSMGGIAFSLLHPQELTEIEASTLSFTDKISYQYNLNAFPLENYREILRLLPKDRVLTLLGFKENKIPAPYHHQGWLAMARRAGVTLSIDTTLARQYPEELEEVDDIFYETEEGKSSMYIDAVTNRCGRSSYEKTEPCTPENIIQLYKKY